MQESLFVVAHFYEGGIESGQDFFHPSEIHVANHKLVVGLLFVKFDKYVVLQQSDVNLRSVRVDVQVARHRLLHYSSFWKFFRHGVLLLWLTF